jgi:hypothetical protein
MKKPPSKKTKARDIAEQIETTLGAELRKLKAEATKAHQQYSRERDPALKSVHLANWLKLSAAVTAMAKIAPKADEQAGALLKKTDVDSVWSRALKEFRSTLEAMPRRAATNSLFHDLDPVDVVLVLEEEVKQALTSCENIVGKWG